MSAHSSFYLEVHTKENVNGSKTLECDDLLDEMFSTNERFSKVSCQDEQYETTTLDVHHRHKLILQLRISPDRERPPTKDISISLLNVVSKLGSNHSNCIQVDSVNRDPGRNSWTAIVNVHVTAETPPSCDMFGDRTPHISFACESLESQGDEEDRRFKLDYSDDLNSQLMDPLDNIEAQLFIHWYLNEQLMGCPVIQYNLTKHHFNKVSREGYFTTVISGPIPKTFCQEMREKVHYAAHSCAARGNIGNKSAQIENAIYYLRPQEPFYQFDLPWYMNKYNELINQMNEHKQKCEFNGFIKLYQGDGVRKR